MLILYLFVDIIMIFIKILETLITPLHPELFGLDLLFTFA